MKLYVFPIFRSSSLSISTVRGVVPCSTTVKVAVIFADLYPSALPVKVNVTSPGVPRIIFLFDEKTSAIELSDGRIVTGKTGDLLGPCSAALLNVLKELAGIDHEIKILSPESIAPIQKLKTNYLGSKNPRLHTDEVLIALSATAANNEDAAKALSQLPKLKGAQVHSTVLLSFNAS